MEEVTGSNPVTDTNNQDETTEDEKVRFKAKQLQLRKALEEYPTYETESSSCLRKAEDQMDDGRRVEL